MKLWPDQFLNRKVQEHDDTLNNLLVEMGELVRRLEALEKPKKRVKKAAE